jgi:hypothetical protein
MGVGDELLAMGDAARLRGGREIKVAIGDGRSPYTSPLHQNVPWLWQAGERIPADAHWIISHPGNRPYCDYDRMIREARERFGWKGGIDGKQAFQLLKRKYWRQSYHATPAPVALTDWECAMGRLLINQLEGTLVLIEPNIKPGAPENKRWPFARYQQVVNAYKDRCTFVQFGRPLLDGAVALAAQPVRIALGLLMAVDAYVGTEGFLHHAAAALGKPAVVIFGGYINPKVTGYTSHQNLWVECEDEGCPGPTPAGEAALAAITVKQVVAALDLALDGRE